MKRDIITFAATPGERSDVAQELHAYADRLGRETSAGAGKRAKRMHEIASTISGMTPLDGQAE